MITKEEALKVLDADLRHAELCLEMLEAAIKSDGNNTKKPEKHVIYEVDQSHREVQENVDTYRMAIDALREKEERENPKLLTMDELKKMNGEPVWVGELNYWAVVGVEQGGRWHGVPFVYTNIDGVSYGWDAERRNLHCYRHKPKVGKPWNPSEYHRKYMGKWFYKDEVEV